MVMEHREYIKLAGLFETSEPGIPLYQNPVVSKFISESVNEWNIMYQTYKAEQTQANPNLN